MVGSPSTSTKHTPLTGATAKVDKAGSEKIHFGGDPKQSDFPHIVQGWIYIVILYQPKERAQDGSWIFTNSQAVE